VNEPRLWLVNEELIAGSTRGRLHVAKVIELINGQAIWDAGYAFNQAIAHEWPFAEPWPHNFPRPHIRLDDPDYAPDFFTLENWTMCSARLLTALRLNPDDADLLPVTLTGNCARAQSAGYHMLRIRRFADVIDYEASDCDFSWPTSAKTGAPYRHVNWMGRMRFRSDLELPADLFEPHTGIYALTTDALALRVIEAKCTGIEFVHPLWFNEVGLKVVRTATGVEKHVYADDDASYETIPMTWDEADAGPQTPPTTGIADYILPPAAVKT